MQLKGRSGMIEASIEVCLPLSILFRRLRQLVQKWYNFIPETAGKKNQDRTLKYSPDLKMKKKITLLLPKVYSCLFNYQFLLFDSISGLNHKQVCSAGDVIQVETVAVTGNACLQFQGAIHGEQQHICSVAVADG